MPPKYEELDLQELDLRPSEEESLDLQPLDLQPIEEPSFVSKRAKTLAEDFAPRGDEGILESVARAPLRLYNVAGEVAGGVGDIIGMGITAGAKGIYSTLPEEAQKGFGSTMKDVGEYVTPTIKTLSDAYGRGRKEYPDLFRFIESTANIAGAIPFGWVAGRTAPIAKAAVGETGEMIARGASATKQAFFPKPNPEEAMGQILRSRGGDLPQIERDIQHGFKSLEAVGDLKGIKDPEVLLGKLNETAKPILTRVDDALLQDPKLYKLDELVTTKSTKGGEKISSNYVDDALTHLEEYYTKVGEPVRAAEMVELRQKAISEGLLKKEVNDIARTYNAEFNEKMFNKGDVPLTSVNAEHARNVRTELKNVARRGLDDTAKELDETYGAIMNTKRLIEQNLTALQKYKAYHDELGLYPKAMGWLVEKTDMLTGNTLSKLLRGIQKGTTDKPINMVEWDKKLTKNLRIIEKEIVKNKPPMAADPSDIYAKRGEAAEVARRAAAEKRAIESGKSITGDPAVPQSTLVGVTPEIAGYPYRGQIAPRLMSTDARLAQAEADAMASRAGQMNIPERPLERTALEKALDAPDEYMATGGGFVGEGGGMQDTVLRISPEELNRMRLEDILESGGAGLGSPMTARKARKLFKNIR